MTVKTEKFTKDALKIDCETELEKISETLRKCLRKFKKRGIIVALSGGIDSSVVGAIATHALGKERVLGLFMPEKDSSGDTLKLSHLIADHLQIEAVCEDITPILTAAGCYSRRDDAIRQVIPEYDDSYKCKIVLPSLTDSRQYRFFSVVVESPEGKIIKARLSADSYLNILAASNFKQRTRKMMEYYYADKNNYIVAGTPNRQEYDQGFFVKGGDGLADIKPIAHLYKLQVYQMAAYLNIPDEIQQRGPTTDTYSMEQSQEEFYFSVPYDKMDICLYAKNNNINAEQTAQAAELTPEQVRHVFKDIEAKRTATAYLQSPPIMIEKVSEVNTTDF